MKSMIFAAQHSSSAGRLLALAMSCALSAQAFGSGYLVPCSDSSYAEDLAKDALAEYQELAKEDPESYASKVELWPIYKVFETGSKVAGYFFAAQETQEEWMLTDLYLCTKGDFYHFYVENEAQLPKYWLHKGVKPRKSNNTVYQDEADMKLTIEPVNDLGVATVKFSVYEMDATQPSGSDRFQFQIPN